MYSDQVQWDKLKNESSFPALFLVLPLETKEPFVLHPLLHPQQPTIPLSSPK